MPLRMAGYIIRAIEQHNLPIYSSVIYLRRSAGRRDPGHFIQEISGRDVLIEYTVIRLIEIEGQAILDGGPVGLLPFTPLMKRPADTDSEAWLRECIYATDALALDDAKKVDILDNLMILSGLGYEVGDNQSYSITGGSYGCHYAGINVYPIHYEAGQRGRQKGR